MKVTNKPFIRRILLLLSVITVFLSILCIAYWFVPHHFSVGEFSVVLVLLLLTVFVYFQLRYIEFDSSGEVLVIKNYHPSKNGKYLHEIKAVELPKQRIKQYSVQNGFWVKKLTLVIENDSNQKLREITFSLSQMNMLGVNKISQELERQFK